MTGIVTGEAVVLDLPQARFPSRLLARALDTVIQLALLLVMSVVVVAAGAGGGLDTAAAAAISLTVSVLIIVGYPVMWETFTRGATPGKFALGLRVVSDDGGPERFRQALVRGLAGVVEFWLLFGFPALLCSLLSADGKRIGDFLAGTTVVQRRVPQQAPAAAAFAVPPGLAAWAATLELASLSDETAEMAREYLSRLPQLDPAARDELGRRLAADVATQVAPWPPAGTPAPYYLAAVLAERRRRATARLAGLTMPAPGTMPTPGTRPAPGPAGTPGVSTAPSGVPAQAPASAAGDGSPAGPGTQPGGGGFAPPR